MARVACEAGDLHTAAAVVSVIGALVGAAKGNLGTALWSSVAVRMGWVNNPITPLLVGSGSTIAIFGLLGMVGTGLVLAGRRLGA